MAEAVCGDGGEVGRGEGGGRAPFGGPCIWVMAADLHENPNVSDPAVSVYLQPDKNRSDRIKQKKLVSRILA